MGLKIDFSLDEVTTSLNTALAALGGMRRELLLDLEEGAADANDWAVFQTVNGWWIELDRIHLEVARAEVAS